MATDLDLIVAAPVESDLAFGRETTEITGTIIPL